MIAPEVFELDDVDGHAHANSEQVPGELRRQVRDAARSCPEQAIVFEVNRAGAPAQNGSSL
jgi:ferredoxin